MSWQLHTSFFRASGVRLWGWLLRFKPLFLLSPFIFSNVNIYTHLVLYNLISQFLRAKGLFSGRSGAANLQTLKFSHTINRKTCLWQTFLKKILSLKKKAEVLMFSLIKCYSFFSVKLIVIKDFK
jgi:hypothetical protein